MKKSILLIIILAVIIVALAGVLLLVPAPKVSQGPKQINNNQQNSLGIQVTSPITSQQVQSPLEVMGVVTANGWSGFEGQVGSVKLLDANGAVLASAPLTATTPWMQLPTQFATQLTFSVPTATNGSLVFHNENPSGDPLRDKTYTIPVIFK